MALVVNVIPPTVMAVPFIETVEFATLESKVAVFPAVGYAVVGFQLVLRFQFPSVVPVQLALAAKHSEEEAAASRPMSRRCFFMMDVMVGLSFLPGDLKSVWVFAMNDEAGVRSVSGVVGLLPVGLEVMGSLGRVIF